MERAALLARRVIMAGNAHQFINFYETAETKIIREEYNLASVGERGTSEDPDLKVELPTAAGSVMLDLASLGASEGSGPPSIGSRPPSAHTPKATPKAGSAKGGKGRKGRRKSEDLGPLSDDDAQATGAPGKSGPEGSDTTMALLRSRNDGEEDVPPLTAEVGDVPCACHACFHHTQGTAHRAAVTTIDEHAICLPSPRRMQKRVRRERRC